MHQGTHLVCHNISPPEWIIHRVDTMAGAARNAKKEKGNRCLWVLCGDVGACESGVRFGCTNILSVRGRQMCERLEGETDGS